jgi:hypothetical protein
MSLLQRSTQIGKVTIRGSGVGGSMVKAGRRSWTRRRLANVTGEGDMAISITLIRSEFG